MKKSIEFGIISTTILIILVLGLSSKSNYLIDDSFITFRYARNLIEGHGLVWNIGGDPTQGYTNFLFVLIMALGLTLKADPIQFALGANIVGLVLLITSVYFFLKSKNVQIPVRLLTIAIIGSYSATVENLNSGLETLFWTGLIFFALFLNSIKPSTKRTIILYIIILIVTLTRPEGAIFAVCWALVSIFKKQNNKSENFMILFYLVGLSVYIGFNFLYFGYVLPNSALVKISQPFQFPGLFYLILTFTENKLLVLTTAFTTLLFGFVKKISADFLKFIPFFLLVPFYLMTDPYMGMYGRYYYPLIICLIVILSLATDSFSKILMNMKIFNINKPENNKYLIGMVAIIPLIVIFVQSVLFTYKNYNQSFEQPLLSREIEIGKKLATQDFSKDILFAYADAGSIPFYSGVRFLDLVGLNDNSIALYARSRGADWVVNYTLNQEPDIIGFYSTRENKIYNNAHGIIGKNYSDLYTKMTQDDHYIYNGGFDCDWIIINFFTKSDSKYKDLIVEFFANIEGIHKYLLIP